MEESDGLVISLAKFNSLEAKGKILWDEGGLCSRRFDEKVPKTTTANCSEPPKLSGEPLILRPGLQSRNGKTTYLRTKNLLKKRIPNTFELRTIRYYISYERVYLVNFQMFEPFFDKFVKLRNFM